MSSRITVKRAMNELAAHGFVTAPSRARHGGLAYNAAVPVVYGRFDTLFDALKRMGLETKVVRCWKWPISRRTRRWAAEIEH